MPYTGTPWIRKAWFIADSGEHIILDTPAWFAWLETASSFCYCSLHSHLRFTARKEKRRHHFYWYGYLKSNAKLHNIYLGKSSKLTIAHLEQATRTLAHKARSST